MWEILERGDIGFLYRPRVHAPAAEEHVRGIDDVQRLFVLLAPEHRELFRRIVVGRKRLPDLPGERYWGYVDRVGTRATDVRADLEEERYTTATRGPRVQPAARSGGEGVYALFRHDDHAHLCYRLARPTTPGSMQDDLGIGREASWIVAVKNPTVTAPPGIGAPDPHAPHLPGSLHERFAQRRFVEADPSLLDCEGIELILIAAGEELPMELDVRLQPEREAQDTADVFAQLGAGQIPHASV
jgi:hypothetical protein